MFKSGKSCDSLIFLVSIDLFWRLYLGLSPVSRCFTELSIVFFEGELKYLSFAGDKFIVWIFLGLLLTSNDMY